MRFAYWLFLGLVILSLILIVLVALNVIPYGFFIVIFLPPLIFSRKTVSGEKYPESFRYSPNRTLIVCPNCGFPLRGYENFCPRCGARLR